MHHIGKAVKYILWIVFSCIVLMLLIGWAKMDWNMSSYVGFLNMSNWSNFDIAQPSTWSAPFWASSDYSGSIAESMSGAVSTSVSSGLDVYDPSFEEDLNTLSSDSTSGNTDEYGFTTDTQDANSAISDESQTTGSTAKTELYNLIKKSVKK